MGFFSRMMAAAFGPSQPFGQDGWFVRLLGGGPTDAGVTVTESGALCLPVVYACVNRISNPLAMFPLKILQATPSGGAAEVTQHPLSGRIDVRPNDYMSSRTLRKVVQSHALLWGNGYIEIERDNAGRAVQLWPLLADRTAPRRVGERLVMQTTIDGKTFELDHGDVLHIMDLSYDGYVGHSQIAMARQAIGMALAMEKFGAKFFANDAKSGGFLMHPGKLSSNAHTNLKGGDKGGDGENKPNAANPASRLQAQGGLDNAHRIKVLEEGMKFVQTTVPPEDAQFLGSREFQIAEIARIYDVPLVLLQSHEKSTSWGTGVEQLMIGFVRQTIQPWVAAWEQELNWKLFTPEEREQRLYVKFNINALLRGDMAARAAFYRELFSMGVLSPNRICALEDMDPIGEDGETHFVPANFTTLDRAINPPEPPPPVSQPERPTP